MSSRGLLNPLGLVVLLLLALAACSSPQTPAATPTDSPPEAAMPSATPEEPRETAAPTVAPPIDPTPNEAGQGAGNGSGSASSNDGALPEDCDGKSLRFTHDIIRTEDRANLNQAGGIGGVNPPSHTIPSGHGYVGTVDHEYRMPVYLPATAQLTRVGKFAESDEGINAALYFLICGDLTNGISFHFGHISEIAPDIESQTGCEGDNCEWYERDAPLELEAGTLIGYRGGPRRDHAGGIDIGVKDLSDVANLPGGHEVWGERIHSACPFDYFVDEEIRAYYQQLLAVNARREPHCGTLELNVEGTLQGYWFDPGTPWPTGGDEEGNHLTFGLATTNAMREFMATGSLVSAGGWYESASSGQVNRAAADVTADGSKYCIENMYNHSVTSDPVHGIVILQMLTPVDLTAEYVDADGCPGDIDGFSFTSQAKVFERFKEGWE